MMRSIIDDQLYAHFVTFGCYKRRQNALARSTKADCARRLESGIAAAGCLMRRFRGDAESCVRAGLVSTARLPEPIPARMETPSSRLIREWYGRQQLRYFEHFEVGIRFWQPKYHAFEIWERAKIEEKLDYMHANPIRAGLVAKAVDWPWSSARWYLEHKSVGVPMTWVNCD